MSLQQKMPEFTFDAINHRYYLDGRYLPNISRIIRPLQSIEFFTEAGRDRGTDVHNAISNYTLGHSIILATEYMGYLDAYILFCRDHGYESILTESPLYHRAGLWAGTPDQYGLMRGRDAACFEVKTGAHHPAHAIQTAAQSELIASNGHKRPGLRFTLQLKSDGCYAIHMHKGHSDLSVFNALLTAWRWANNHNIQIGEIE